MAASQPPLLFLLTTLLAISLSFAASTAAPVSRTVGRNIPISNVDDPIVQEIAKFAVAGINNKEHKSYAYVKVLSGTSQVVGGTSYTLQIQVRDSKHYYYYYTYEVVVYDRPWDKIRLLNSYKLLETVVPGRWETIRDVTTPKVQAIAKFAVDEIAKKTNIKYGYVKVASGESQLVSGTNYRLRIEVSDPFGGSVHYQVVVYDKPWEKVRQLVSYAPPPGGWMAIEDVSTAAVQDIAKFAIREINRKEKKGYEYVRVNNGESQVVAGANYRLEIVAKMGYRHYRTFHVKVYEKAWEKYRELVWFKAVGH